MPRRELTRVLKLRRAMNALHNGIGTDNVSGEPLSSEMVKAARRLELEFFEKVSVCTRVPRAQALAEAEGNTSKAIGSM